MKKTPLWLASAIAAICLFAGPPRASAQIAVQIGPPPVCPYGYYDYPPYECAPYGYYGPEWFSGGVFIGAGPWFHGPEHFYGHVDNHYDVHRGYNGPRPSRGEHPDANHRVDHMEHFKGNEMRDGRGHVGGGHPR
jgi:hypothetical protein